jgi:prepilin-type N-terminal cleavage/methylation domain-containing protein
MKRDRARRAQRGFTLLELLMTLTVTTIGLAGLMSLHLSIARGNDGASRFAEATQFANATLEQLRAKTIVNMLAGLPGSPTAPPVDVTLPTVAGRAGMTYTRRVVITQLNSASTSLWRIRVEVGWIDDGADMATGAAELKHLVAAELIRTVEEQL